MAFLPRPGTRNPLFSPLYLTSRQLIDTDEARRAMPPARSGVPGISPSRRRTALRPNGPAARAGRARARTGVARGEAGHIQRAFRERGWISTPAASSAKAHRSGTSSAFSPRWPPPTAPCWSRANRAPARNCWCARCTPTASAGPCPSCPSTAGPFPRNFWNRSSSATRRAPSPMPSARGPAGSNWPTAAPSSWTKSARWT